MTKSPALDPNDVLDFLKNTPDFLEKFPDACAYLTPPAEKKQGGIADFGSYLVKRLKKDHEDVMNTSRDIMETARSNMNNVTRIHRAALRLLESRTFSEFIEVITSDLAPLLDLDICTLVVEADDGHIPHIHIHGLRMVPADTIDRWLAGNTSLLQDHISGIEAIYGGGATLVRSQALVRVDITDETPPALLAFGSRNPTMFSDGQGTEHVMFLARVTERLFRMWLSQGVV